MKRKTEKILYKHRHIKTYGRKLITWDKEKFLKLAADRGYFHKRSVIFAITDLLQTRKEYVISMLNSGRFKWEQMLAIGSFFEMTPKEFCDIFMRGFFSETPQGHYICQYNGDIEQLLYPVGNVRTIRRINKESEDEG